MSVPRVGITLMRTKVRVEVSLPHDNKKIYRMLTADEADEFSERLQRAAAHLRTLEPIDIAEHTLAIPRPPPIPEESV